MLELEKAGLECALVYSDEHYHGDVPYLCGNINFVIEPCAGILGKNGFHLLVGLEGGYASEQMAKRSGCVIHKAEFLKLADEEYPVAADRIEDILVEACGKMPKNIGIFTPRAVLPGMDFVLIEKTLGKYGKKVEILNKLPLNLQKYVGNVIEK